MTGSQQTHQRRRARMIGGCVDTHKAGTSCRMRLAIIVLKYSGPFSSFRNDFAVYPVCQSTSTACLGRSVAIASSFASKVSQCSRNRHVGRSRLESRSSCQYGHLLDLNKDGIADTNKATAWLKVWSVFKLAGFVVQTVGCIS